MIKIIQPTEENMFLVKKMFSDYYHYLYSQNQTIGVEVCFMDFESELNNLPNGFSAPKGALFLAQDDEKTVGCVGLKSVNESEEVELKRLYVSPGYRKQLVGKQLFMVAIEKATQMGYCSMVLETLPTMKTAIKMYLKFGFVESQAYKEPDDNVMYFRYNLK